MRYTTCIAVSNFIDRDFYFASGRPSNTPPEYAVSGREKEKFAILMESPRSELVDLVHIPNRLHAEVDRSLSNKLEIQVLMSYFFTTQELKAKFDDSFIWNAFAVGRFPLIREELQTYDLIEFTHQTLTSPSYAFFLPREQKRHLLRSVQIQYCAEIETLASRIAREMDRFNAVHIRLGDFRKVYAPEDYDVAQDNYRNYVATTFPDRDVPVLIATDALHEKELIADLFTGYRYTFIDEFVFDNYLESFKILPFTDFNVITIIDQLVCAKAENFIGTYRSTFTLIIHRLRQEREGKRDFNFFPDKRVAMQIDATGIIKPDRSGFFDWNRYSVFSETHNDMSWRREWDFDLTSIDF